MKKASRLLAVTLAILIVLAGMPMYSLEAEAAETLTKGDYEYEMGEDGDSIIIIKYKGDGGEVVIPSEMDGKKVTSIGNQAFSFCRRLTGVTIPDGVTSIGQWAFDGCSGLTSVTIPDGVTSIEYKTFENCSGLTRVIIPSSVTEIWNQAFSGCSGLTSMTIPDGVTSIGPQAFENCSGLTSVTIPNSVTSIAGGVFSGCSGLTSVTIPNSVTSIVGGVFYGCSGLREIKVEEGNSVYDSRDNCNAIIETASNTLLEGCSKTIIPSDVTSIWGSILGGAFSGCSGLTSMTIPDSVMTIGQRAFEGCSGLTSITIPDSVTLIEGDAFKDCSGLTSVTIPNGMTFISPNAFFGCTRLTSMTIPDSVTSIGDDAFSGCSGLTEVKIPDSVTRIGRRAFENCSGLTSVTIPDSVTSIEQWAFSGCSRLTRVIIPSSVTKIESYAFDGCSGLREIKVEEGNSVYDSRDNCNAIIETASATLFQGCNKTIIPSGVTSIGSAAFSGLSGLTEVKIPDSVTSIKGSAFSGCSGLTEVKIPDSVTSIGGGAFSGCSRLTEVAIPNRVTSIMGGLFYHCSGLTRVTIPSSVTSIGNEAFSGCSGLTRVTIPSSVTSIGDDVFSFCSGLMEIKVEEGNSVYDSRDNCNAIIITASATLLQGCNKTVIPSNVTSIWNQAFMGSGLTEVKIPDSVTSIKDRAFYGCNGLTEVMISDSVTSIGMEAFLNCSSLTKVTIPNSVTRIEYCAFGYIDGADGQKKIPNFIICGTSGSEAERYAKEHEFTFHADSSDDPSPGDNNKIDISQAAVTLSQSSYTYDGTEKKPSVTVVLDGKTLVLDTDYTVAYSNNTDAGTAKVTVTGKGNYIGSKTVNFTIAGAVEDPSQGDNSKIDISQAAVTLSQSSYTYDGTEKKPSVTVALDGKTLVLDTDYTVAYSNNTDAGTAKVTVTGKGNYTGSKTVNFTIAGAAKDPSQGDNNKIDISQAAVTLSQSSYTYDGTEKRPSVTVTLDGKTLVLDTDYTVAYSDNTDAGTAKVTVTGKGDYTGSKTVNFTIAGAAKVSSITCKKVLYKVAYGTKPFRINAASKNKLSFTSTKPKIASVHKSTGKVTIKNTGVAVIMVRAGKDSVKVTVKVSPKKQSVKSAGTQKGRKLTVKWAKDKRASGYQVQVSAAKNFKKGTKSKNVSRTSYTFTKLNAGRKYYVRVRSYKKSGKETLYGGWSKARLSGKIKK